MVRTLLAALLLLQSLPVLAQRLPPPALLIKEEDRSRPLEMAKVDVDVRVVGQVAETRMTMTFYNPQDRVLAGDLYFPLPEGTTVSGYALDIEGKMVDGVVVEKDKARQVFEAEVRKGIDPGLVEWVKGNNFKTRVYPIPAGGTRTVMVRTLSELTRDDAGPNYLLPLNFKNPVGEFHLRVEVVKPQAAPEVKAGKLSNFQFKGWRESFLAETTLKKKKLTEDLVIAIPDTRSEEVRVAKAADEQTYFYVRQDASRTLLLGNKPPKRVAVYWDRSGSRGGQDLGRETKLLEELLARFGRGPVAVDLVFFNNRMDPPVTFTVKDGHGEKLLARIAEVDYDGGTQMGALKPLTGKHMPDYYLLFSDGLSTFGKEEPTRFNAPVFAVGSASSTNHSFLRFLALRSGGAYFNLQRLDNATVLPKIGTAPWSFLGATVIGGRVSGIYPSVPQPVPGQFFLVGRLESDTARIRLDYGYGGRVEQSMEVTVSRGDATEQELLRTFWAQNKIAELMIFPERNADELVATGQEFGLVTPGTSLMVLETLEQYVEHRIAPPRSLPEMRQEYFAQVEEFHRQRAAEEEDKIVRVLAMWQSRVDWWNQKFDYPPDFKWHGAEEKKEAEADGAVMGMGGSGGGSGRGMAMERSIGAASVEEARAEAPAPRAARAMSKMKKKDGKDDEPPAPEPEITIKEWDPETPYLKVLKGAEDDRFAVYMNQRKEYGTSPAFFLDCADFFFKEGNEVLGLQVLSNIVELELENPALYRVVAHRLAQKGKFELSAQLFEKVLKLRPEEPQSYRDLALVLDQLQEFERAVDLLYHVVLNEWDRFDEIEVIALMELNRVLERAKRAGKGTSRVDPRLVKLLDVDVRIILTWDTDLTDMDLWVTEPSGEKADYSHNRTTIGGLVSRDFTQGYGPEEYVLKKAMRGPYKIEANYYGSSAPSLTGAVTLQVDVFTNYGRADEKRKTLTVRLTQSKDEILVGTITF